MAENCEINSTEINFINATSILKVIRWLKFCKTTYIFKCELQKLKPPLTDIPNMLALSTYEDCMNTRQLTAYCISMILSIAIIFANIVIIATFIKNRNLFTSSNLPIFSLSISDFLTGLTFLYSSSWNLVILTAGYEFDITNTLYFIEKRSNKYLCLTLDGPGLLFACMMSSVLSLGLIATERYTAIFYPFRYHDWITTPRMVICTVGLWVISCLVGILPLLGWSHWNDRCTLTEIMDYGYLILWSIVCFISGLLILFIYIRIFFLTQKHFRQIQAAQVTLSTSSTSIPNISGTVPSIEMQDTIPSSSGNIPCTTTGGSIPNISGNVLTTTVIIHNPQQSCDVKPSTDVIKTNTVPREKSTANDSNRSQNILYNTDDIDKVQSYDNVLTTKAQDEMSGNHSNLLAFITNTDLHDSNINVSYSKNDGATLESSIHDSKRSSKLNLPHSTEMELKLKTKRKSTQASITSKRKSSTNIKQKTNIISTRNIKTRPNMKAITTTGMILGAFYICWLPFLIFLLGFQDKYDQNLTLYYLAIVTQINSLFNPILYGFRQSDIKKAIRKLCHRHSNTTDNKI